MVLHQELVRLFSPSLSDSFEMSLFLFFFFFGIFLNILWTHICQTSQLTIIYSTTQKRKSMEALQSPTSCVPYPLSGYCDLWRISQSLIE